MPPRQTEEYEMIANRTSWSMAEEVVPEINEHPRQEGVSVSRVKGVRDAGPTYVIYGDTRVAGALINFTYEAPKEPDDEAVAIIAPGYGGVKQAYEDFRHHLALNGKPAVSYSVPRVQRASRLFEARHWIHPELLPAMAVHGIVKATREVQGHDRFDLVAHSLGTWAALLSAEHNPGEVENIVMLAGAGLGNHKFAEMLNRVPTFVKVELAPAARRLGRPAVIASELMYMLSNPCRTFSEGYAVSGCNNIERIKRVRAGGTGVAALQFQSDTLFPLESLSPELSIITDVYGVYHDESAGHIAPQLDSEGVAIESLRMIAETRAARSVAA